MNESGRDAGLGHHRPQPFRALWPDTVQDTVQCEFEYKIFSGAYSRARREADFLLLPELYDGELRGKWLDFYREGRRSSHARITRCAQSVVSGQRDRYGSPDTVRIAALIFLICLLIKIFFLK